MKVIISLIVVLKVDKSPGATIATAVTDVIQLNIVGLEESEPLGHGHYPLYPEV